LEFLLSTVGFADKFSVVDASVRPSSHITAKALLTLVLIILTKLGHETKLKAFVPHILEKRGLRTVDVLEAIKGRRSVRVFKSERSVSQEDVWELIEAARWAPSAGNVQPWEFVIVRKPQMKRKLALAALGQSFIEEASVVVVVCADENRSSESYGQRGRTLYCIQDTAAAIQNINLAAHSLGLGTCWVGAFQEEEVKKALETPRGIRPVALIPVGQPLVFPSPRTKRAVGDMVHYETFHSR
jgi:nitroreductase